MAKKQAPRDPIVIGGQEVGPGQRETVDLFVARLYTHTEMAMPVKVLHGEQDGPTLFLSATLHGDEINGVEIIRQVLRRLRNQEVRGTLLAVPVVNVFGFVYQSRYLPDRRDLNRSFPGSSRGSQASRMAHLFFNEVVARCQYGIDLHTAAPPRTNLPQIRADLRDDETRRCALAFGAPLMMGSAGPEGSLRRVAARRGIHLLVYEAGEPHRFNEDAIAMGVDGVMRVLKRLGMIDLEVPRTSKTRQAEGSRWVRARQSGVFRLQCKMGDSVEKDDPIGVIADPFGDDSLVVRSPISGVVIGHVISPLVHRGEAVVHIADCAEIDTDFLSQ